MRGEEKGRQSYQGRGEAHQEWSKQGEVREEVGGRVISWDQTVGALQIAIDSVKRGDIDQAEITRQIEDDDSQEVFRFAVMRSPVPDPVVMFEPEEG